MCSIFVDSTDAVRGLLEAIKESPAQPPLLFLDLEGVKLSRHGSIAIMQILAPARGKVFIVDVHTLNQQAFNTQSPDGTTLKGILESTEIPKVFFDVRNDSDALFHHFKISLKCVIDVQLLELATRPYPGKYLQGLSKCVEESTGLTLEERRQWQKVKEDGLNIFDPKRGGKYESFQLRPLPTALLDYCVQDVMLLPKLLINFAKKLQTSTGYG
jgi:exonuclease 3'-5' domain-containing protein 1